MVTLAMLCSGTVMVTSAWSAPRLIPRPGADIPHPIIGFDDADHLARLVLPNPPCPSADTGCVWMLRVNEPEVAGSPLVGSVSGTSGILTVAFPAFCGVIQADALLGPAPWRIERGIRETIDLCASPPGVTPTANTPEKSPTSELSSVPFTASTTPGHTDPAQLPFTGLDIRPLGILGVGLVLIGGMLASTAERRRHFLRRTGELRVDDVTHGVRRTGGWFVGR